MPKRALNTSECVLLRFMQNLVISRYLMAKSRWIHLSAHKQLLRGVFQKDILTVVIFSTNTRNGEHSYVISDQWKSHTRSGPRPLILNFQQEVLNSMICVSRSSSKTDVEKNFQSSEIRRFVNVSFFSTVTFKYTFDISLLIKLTISSIK